MDGMDGMTRLNGTVALAHRAGSPAAGPDATSSYCSVSPTVVVGVRRLPVPAGCDPARGPLVPPLRLSYRDLEELLADRGIDVDHVSLHRWMQRFTPPLVDAASPCRHAGGSRWFVDETYVKVPGRGATSTGRSTSAARCSMSMSRPAGRGRSAPLLRVDDRDAWPSTRGRHGPARALARVIDELLPAAFHDTDRYSNNRIECRSRAPQSAAAADALAQDRPHR